MELTPNDLQAILTFTITLARKAGEVILQGSEAIQQAGSNVDEKKNSVDLVTEYDVKVEELVKKQIAETYPDFKLCVSSLQPPVPIKLSNYSVGEESYAAGSRNPLTDDPTFCVDPIGACLRL